MKPTEHFFGGLCYGERQFDDLRTLTEASLDGSEINQGHLKSIGLDRPLTTAEHACAVVAALSRRSVHPLSPAIANTMANESRQFHIRAGTLTSQVEETIAQLRKSQFILRVAHTTDFFGYLAFFLTLIRTHCLQKVLLNRHGVRFPVLLLLIDWDDIGDRRLSRSWLPNLHQTNKRSSLSYPVKRYPSIWPQHAATTPIDNLINEWIHLLATYIDRYCGVFSDPQMEKSMRTRWLDSLSTVEKWIKTAQQACQNFADFNAIFLTHFVNIGWGLPTAVIPMGRMVNHLLGAYETILGFFPEAASVAATTSARLRSEGVCIGKSVMLDRLVLPLWFLCPTCGRKLRVLRTDHYSAQAEATCSSCRAIHRIYVGKEGAPSIAHLRSKIYPRVFVDELTDALALGSIGGVSYVGSAEHVLFYSEIARQIGMPFPEETLYRPRAVHAGPAEIALGLNGTSTFLDESSQVSKQLIRGRFSILYYALAIQPSLLGKLWLQALSTDPPPGVTLRINADG